MEIWKPVVGYEGLYEVSNHGNVRSLDRFVKTEKIPRKGKILTPRVDVKGNGYRYTNLSRNGKGMKVSVHVLVLEAFVGIRPSKLHHARHKDGNPENPRLDNLEWGTVAENMQDKLKHGTAQRGEKSGKSKLTQEFVSWILESKQNSLVLAKMFGVASSTIRSIRLGQNWSYK